jgi:hypothetical protein
VKRFCTLLGAGVVACAVVTSGIADAGGAVDARAATLSPTAATATPRPGDIDTLSYFINTHHKALAGTHSYSQTVKGNKIYNVKWDSDAYEMYTYDSKYIYLKEDHSGGTAANGSYTFSDGRWMKRYMAVGDSIRLARNMWTEFNVGTSSCSFSGGGYMPYENTLIAHYPHYGLGGNLGHQDVIVLQYDYRWGLGVDYERDYYAKGYGLVKWQLYENNQVTQTSIFNKITKSAPTPPDVANSCSGTPVKSPVPPLPKSLHGFVTMLYTCVLHYSRSVVGTSGYEYWLNELKDGTLSIQGAYTDFYGYQPTSWSNNKFVENLYECTLFRTIDPANEQNVVAQLAAGTITRPQLVSSVVNSAEFNARELPLLSALR